MSNSSELESRIRELEEDNLRLREQVGQLSELNTKLLSRQHKFQTILDHMPSMIGYWDKDLHNRFGNKAYLDWFGIDYSQMEGMHIREVIGEERYRLNLPYIEAALRGVPQTFERAIPEPNSNKVRQSLAEYIPEIVDGEVRGFFVLVSDITIIKEAEAAIKNLAYMDALTNLPNRRLFSDRLTQAMANSKRGNSYAAVMFLDMDKFKALNDTWGHEAGDALLIEVARRIKACLRGMDTVARFGGDEFVVLLNDLDANRAEATLQAGAVAEKIRIALSQPYRLALKQGINEESAFEYLCSASIGVVLFTGYEMEMNEIFRCADSSMYLSKKCGSNSVHIYDPS
ncbi:MAG TPA: diguanylate cyclase [Gallionella sp.]|nr:diguanylate cyclase [Gallionella sp.]